jgi:predicted RNase H-like HicB family nuclease
MGRDRSRAQLAELVGHDVDFLFRDKQRLLKGFSLPLPGDEALLRGSVGYLAGVAETLRLTIAYDEPDELGWIVARVIEVPGAVSQGRTQEEARENVIDALRLMLAPDDDDPNVAAGRSEPLELILTG